MDLFEAKLKDKLKNSAPLADRMRPVTIDDFVGQTHIMGKGKLLRRAIAADRVLSLIFYGPPGSGKTTLARVIANSTKAQFVQLNAVTAGVRDIRAVVEKARDRLSMHNRHTILFVDEIHRFNKAQQDALLPSVEEGTVTFIGATTENPYFEVVGPLISRSRIFRLEPLNSGDLQEIIERALGDAVKGFGSYDVSLHEDALEHIVAMANGDARTALNALELAVLTTEPDSDGRIVVTLDIAAESVQRKPLLYDKNGDQHYDTVSAFIKSMRGGDPDAALYYLARMLEAGENLRFICRRIIICAAEDVGNADPMALVIANNAAQAADFVGMPEARIILAQAATYVACTLKSNRSYVGVNKAIEDVRNGDFSGIPVHLRDASYKGARKLGHGKDYKYPHDYPGDFVRQQYLPDSLKDKRYYIPTDHGVENGFRKNLVKWWSVKEIDNDDER